MVSDRTLGSTPCVQSSDQTSPEPAFPPKPNGKTIVPTWHVSRMYIPKSPVAWLIGALAATSDKLSPPFIVVADTNARKLTLRTPPAACRPEFLAQGPGIMVLGCNTLDGTSLYTSDTGLKWKIEAEIPDVKMRSPQLDWAEDGTLLLGGLCAKTSERGFEAPSLSSRCRLAALRKPQELGEAGLWAILPANEGFLAHRAMSGGQALVAPGSISFKRR